MKLSWNHWPFWKHSEHPSLSSHFEYPENWKSGDLAYGSDCASNWLYDQGHLINLGFTYFMVKWRG